MTASKINNEFLQLLNDNIRIINHVSCLYNDTEEDREDMKQEICLQLWRSYKTFRGNSSISTWLYKVALNTALTYFKKRKRHPEQQTICKGLVVVGEEEIEFEKQEQIEQLYRAIGKLNKLDKALVMLYLDNKPYDEISQILGISSGNARVRMLRIKEQLKNLIEE